MRKSFFKSILLSLVLIGIILGVRFVEAWDGCDAHDTFRPHLEQHDDATFNQCNNKHKQILYAFDITPEISFALPLAYVATPFVENAQSPQTSLIIHLQSRAPPA
jgi:hypothetical protein